MLGAQTMLGCHLARCAARPRWLQRCSVLYRVHADLSASSILRFMTATHGSGHRSSVSLRAASTQQAAGAEQRIYELSTFTKR
jgi:hypothetical protein